MAQIELTWIEKQRFLGVDSTGHSVVLSGADDVGVKPSDTLLIALAACVAFDIVEILHKRASRAYGGAPAAIRPPRRPGHTGASICRSMSPPAGCARRSSIAPSTWR